MSFSGFSYDEYLSIIVYDGHFRKPSQDLTTYEVANLFTNKSEKFLINTPNGPFHIVEWFDLSFMDVKIISTKNRNVICTDNQFIEKENGIWTQAKSLISNDKIITINGPEEVIKVLTPSYREPCATFSINSKMQNNKIWLHGVSALLCNP